MAKQPKNPSEGSWLVAEELLERGDPAFVDELRKITDADRLGTFAAKWYADRRAASRKLMLEYLDRPLNAYRHEPLVKRLFKLAEQAADDEVMGRFLILFDRSVRRVRRKKRHYDWQTRDSWEEEQLRVPGGRVMPRKNPWSQNPYFDDVFRRLVQGGTLFTVHTRNYLRRRTWRYFRKLGKQHPERFVPAVTAVLKLYQDTDVANGLALIDNWGLMHVLFHHNPALVAKPHGWTLAQGHTLAELAPAPIYDSLWKTSPRFLIDLLKEARCRPVRQWAIRLIRRDHDAVLAALPLIELLDLLAHSDFEVVALAAEALRSAPGLDDLSLDRWLALLETPTPEALDILCELMARHLHPDKATLDQTVRLACRRPLPVARLGLKLLQSKRPTNEVDCRALLGLVEAEAEPLRPDLVRWARGVLSASESFQPVWVLEYLDSRHVDVRAEGWAWLREEARVRDDVQIWRRLLESPYDDVRLQLIADLEQRATRREQALSEHVALEPELVRSLWAAVLLNIYRGNRSKPVVVRQLVRRVAQRPDEANQLLPILSVALRSVRGPEWRAGLCGVVQLVERNPELAALVREAFPEMKLT